MSPSGTVNVRRRAIAASANRPDRATGVGYVADGRIIFPDPTVQEILEVGAKEGAVTGRVRVDCRTDTTRSVSSLEKISKEPWGISSAEGTADASGRADANGQSVAAFAG